MLALSPGPNLDLSALKQRNWVGAVKQHCAPWAGDCRLQSSCFRGLALLPGCWLLQCDVAFPLPHFNLDRKAWANGDELGYTPEKGVFYVFFRGSGVSYRVSYTLGWPQISYEAEDNLQLLILLPPPPKSWDYRPVPPHLHSHFLLNVILVPPLLTQHCFSKK